MDAIYTYSMQIKIASV